MTKARRTAIEILSEFEEVLNRYHVNIPHRKAGPDEARLYGLEYYDLEDAVTHIIQKNQLPDMNIR